MSVERASVRDWMHAGIVSCSPDAPLGEVARIMGDHRVHAVAVADLTHGRPWGTWRIASDLDVIVAIASGKQRTAGEVAAEAVTISADEPLERAAQRMSELRVTHLVVVEPDGGYPVGVISTLDLASAFGGGSRVANKNNTA